MTDRRVFENARYYIKLGKVYDTDRSAEADGYNVINKETGVVEYETFIYPQAVSFAEDAHDHTESLLADDGDKVKASVTPLRSH